MSNIKLNAGVTFPECVVRNLEGVAEDIRQPQGGADWRLVVVFRGQHCPICKDYVKSLDDQVAPLAELNTDVVAVCADSPSQLQAFADDVNVNVPLYGGLTIEQMQTLGLYISEPRNEQETDHPFPEPAIFVINDEGILQIVDISNAPFARPDLQMLVNGIKFIRAKDYPIRGTFSN